MQCRCKKILITRRVVNNITDPDMRNICQRLMQGIKLKAVQEELNMNIAVFDMFIEEIKRLLVDAGIQLRGV